MKIVCAFIVLMSVAAASAAVTENVKVYNPTQTEGSVSDKKPIKPKPIR